MTQINQWFLIDNKLIMLFKLESCELFDKNE